MKEDKNFAIVALRKALRITSTTIYALISLHVQEGCVDYRLPYHLYKLIHGLPETGCDLREGLEGA